MMRGYDGYGRGMFNGGGPEIFACLIGIILFIVVITCIIALIVHFSKANKKSFCQATASIDDNALKILNERLAKGEITAEEYKNIKLHIQS